LALKRTPNENSIDKKLGELNGTFNILLDGKPLEVNCEN
jgi:hypothetical protein